MNKIKLSILVFLIFLSLSCTKDVKKNSVINEKSIELQVLESYQKGLRELDYSFDFDGSKIISNHR